ncbi:MAG: DUF481 domain-containing protein [Thiobacillus sp.]|nr:DUF481 domain-containing protein [Thiobacillus sp.]
MSLKSAADYFYQGKFYQSESGIRFPVGKQLSLAMQLNVDYDAVPAAGKKTTDIALISRLDYSLCVLTKSGTGLA